MLKIENWPLDKIKPYENNPRKNDAAVPKMAAAIREFGFKIPVLAKSGGELIDGHLRHKAAQSLGLSEIPVIVADDLSDAQIKAFRIMVNRSATWADWDYDLLLEELKSLQAENIDLALTGFEENEIDKMLIDLGGEKDADFEPEPPEKPLVKKGDIWILGKHRLMCGDATKADACARLLQGAMLDCVWTDPPYNVDYHIMRQGGHVRKKANIAGDRQDKKSFYLFLLALFKNCFDNMRPGASIYCAYSDASAAEFITAFEGAGFKMSTNLIWRKSNIVLKREGYQIMHESILFGWKPGAKRGFYGDRKQKSVFEINLEGLHADGEGGYNFTIDGLLYRITGENLKVDAYQTSVIPFSKPVKSPLHPTSKPVGLIERMLINSSRKGENVGDFCAGGGSTLIACQKLGRRCFAMEIEPKYCQVIIERWREFTGAGAYRESDNATLEELEAQ